MPNLDRLKTLTWNSWAFQTENQEAIGAAYAHYTEVWEEIIDEIREQRIKKGYSLVFWSAVGITATVLTFGALGPEAISMETAILGSFALAYDMSNMEEGALELYYGCVGDINTTAVNPIRDTVFFGWQEGYDVSGMAANIGFGYFSMRDLASVAGSAAGEMMVGEGTQSVIYGSDDIGKYQYNMVENPGPLAEMQGNPAQNFYGGRYNVEVLTEDRIFYRGGNADNALGQWFTTEPPESIVKVRIDTAVKPQWIDPVTGELTGTSVVDTVYAIKIPKGTTIYTGPVGPQGGAYCGGYDIMQVFIKEPWKLDYQVINKITLK